MKMRDQNGTDGCDTKTGFEDLRLSAFSAIEEEYLALPSNRQGGMLPPFRGDGPTRSKKDHFHAKCIAVFGIF
jgi:hypothetical protein